MLLIARKSRCYFFTSTFSLFIGYLYLLYVNNVAKERSVCRKEDKNEISLLGYASY